MVGGRAGFTLVELLIAMMVTLVAISLAAALVTPAAGAFQVLPEAADAQQRLRVGAEALVSDLLSAGSGYVLGWGGGATLTWPAVLPCQWTGVPPLDPLAGGCARNDAITVLSMAAVAPQGISAETLADPSAAIRIAPLSACSLDRSACRMRPGMRAIIADGTAAWDVFTVTSVSADGEWIGHDRDRLSRRYAQGALVGDVSVRSYYLLNDAAANTYQLRRSEGPSADFPVADDVTALSFDYFGEAAPPQLVNPDDGDRRFTTYGPLPPLPGMDDPLDAWPAGENCTFVVADARQVPRLPSLSADATGLAPLAAASLADGPWCPDALSTNRFDADLLRVRVVRITLRVQARAVAVRGNSGPSFSHPGLARDAWRLVPDLEVRFDVVPRNPAR